MMRDEIRDNREGIVTRLLMMTTACSLSLSLTRELFTPI